MFGSVRRGFEALGVSVGILIIPAASLLTLLAVGYLALISAATSASIGTKVLVELFFRSLKGEVLALEEQKAVFRLSQSLLLLVSTAFIARPIIAWALDSSEKNSRPILVRRPWNPWKDINRYASGVLVDAYDEADEIFVISGDFSWIEEDDPKGRLISVLNQLCQRNKAYMFSYKSSNLINFEKEQSKSISKFIKSGVRSPIDNPKISLVRKGRERTVFYLGRDSERGKLVLYQLNDYGFGSQAIDLVEALFESFRKQRM